MTPGEGLAGDGGGGALRMGDNKLTSDSQQLKVGELVGWRGRQLAVVA